MWERIIFDFLGDEATYEIDAFGRYIYLRQKCLYNTYIKEQKSNPIYYKARDSIFNNNMFDHLLANRKEPMPVITERNRLLAFETDQHMEDVFEATLEWVRD